MGEWLRKPGVRLLAVQSIPEKCAECGGETARWKALAERHRDDGLRVLTIVARDPLLGCIDPGWAPDATVCDVNYDGLAKQWRLPEHAPAAFLFSWTGDLLVERGELGAVEREVERQLASTPEIVIDVRESDHPDELVPALRDAMLESRLYRPAPPPTERARIARLGPGPYAKIHLALPTCVGRNGRIGDAILAAHRARGTIDLTLRSEAGCRVATVSERFRSVKHAVAALIAAIPRHVEMPEVPPPPQIASGELIEDAVTPEGRLQKSRRLLATLSDPLGKRLAQTAAKYLGRSDLKAPGLARAILRETFSIDVGATLAEQLASGPEVVLDLRDPERTLAPGDLIFFVSYAYVPRSVMVYLGHGLMLAAADIRGVVVDPLPPEIPYYFQSVARRPLTAER